MFYLWNMDLKIASRQSVASMRWYCSIRLILLNVYVSLFEFYFGDSNYLHKGRPRCKSTLLNSPRRTAKTVNSVLWRHRGPCITSHHLLGGVRSASCASAPSVRTDSAAALSALNKDHQFRSKYIIYLTTGSISHWHWSCHIIVWCNKSYAFGQCHNQGDKTSFILNVFIYWYEKNIWGKFKLGLYARVQGWY